MIDHLSYPIEIERNARVDTRNTRLAASNAPGNDASKLPLSMAFAYHGTTAVAFASVFAFLASGTDEARMKTEACSESRSPHLTFTDLIVYYRHVDFLQNILVLAKFPESVFTPPSRPTSEEIRKKKKYK